jgi:serine phosphatase RsbU (regulator of sigma subunit)
MQYGIVFKPKEGQSVSGDAYLVAELDEMYMTVVADGLGSGLDAAQAAQLAVRTVGEHLWADLPSILRQCHTALRGTRGAVMSLLKIEVDARRVSYAGIGNVNLRSWTAGGFHPINAYGIVGSRWPQVRAFSGAYTPGDMYVLSTDGITRQFGLDRIPGTPGQSLQALAEHIAAHFGRPEDDVTVLVVA